MICLYILREKEVQAPGVEKIKDSDKLKHRIQMLPHLENF